MRSFVACCLRFRFVVLALACAITTIAVLQIREASVDALPEFTPPYVEIQTEALGLSADEVEQLITVPLEADLLNGVPGVDVIRSSSVGGLSSIVMVFDPDTNLLDARQLVQERLTQAHALPNVSKPPTMLEPLSSTSRVMLVGLKSRRLSLIEQSVLARWTIRPRLLAVHGVANVEIFGERDRQLQVQVDPERLRNEGVTLNQVIRTTGNAQFVSPLTFLEASTPGTGGFIDSQNQRLAIQHIPNGSARALAQVPLEGHDDAAGGKLRLGDVARVTVDHQPLIGDGIVRDGPGLMLVIEKAPGANTLEVTRGVQRALDELRPGLGGMQMDSAIFRPAAYVESGIDNLTTALLLGALLAALALLLLFMEWRAALVILVSTALSLVTAGLVLALRGETVNLLVLAGLTVGLVLLLDDAVVDVEHLGRRLRELGPERSRRATFGCVVDATVQRRRTLFYAAAIALFAVLPLVFMHGLDGSLLHPLVLAYALAILASSLVALTVTPVLGFLLLARAPRERRESPPLALARRGHEAVLRRSLGRSSIVLAAALALGALALAAVPSLSRSHQPALLPSLQDRSLLVRFDGAPGTSLPEMTRITSRATRELRALPGIRGVGAHIGRAVTADQVVEINSAELWVTMAPSADYRRTVTAIQDVVRGYPGLKGDVRTFATERMGEITALDGRHTSDVVNGHENDLVVRVYGQDSAILQRKAAEVQRALSGIDGVVHPHVELMSQEPTVQVETDLTAARRYDIKPGDVRRAATALLSGIVVGSLFEQQKVFDVVVLGSPNTRTSVSSIRNLVIDTPSGRHVRLGDVAHVGIRPTPTVIQRDAVARRLDVVADVSGRSLDAVVGDVRDRLARISFPVEYHAEVLPDAQNRQDAQRRLWVFVIASLIAMFLLLQASLASWRLAAIVFASLPLSLVGAVLALVASGGRVTLGTLLGFLAVLVVALRGSMLMADACRRREGDDAVPAPELVMRGARERFAPILTAALATALLTLPFVVLGPDAGLEILRPMGLVLLGGLVTSTVLTLVVVPVLYLRFQPAQAADAGDLGLSERRAFDGTDLREATR
jgi:Cu/Ag efflux pump CusA